MKNEEILKKYGKRGKYGVVLITTLKDTSSRSSDEIRPVESWIDEALRGSDKKVVYFLKENTNPEDRSLKMPCTVLPTRDPSRTVSSRPCMKQSAGSTVRPSIIMIPPSGQIRRMISESSIKLSII